MARRRLDAMTDQYLRERLGDYLSEREIHQVSGIRIAILNKWRKQGMMEAEQLEGKWYYSVKSLTAAIKYSNVEDLKQIDKAYRR